MILTGAGISKYFVSTFAMYFKPLCQVCPVEYLTSALATDCTRQSKRVVNMSLMTLSKCKLQCHLHIQAAFDLRIP